MPKDLIDRDVAPIAEYIDVLVTSTQVGFRKPRPEGYLKLASEMKTEPRNMIYVGDEPKDIIGANNVGMFSVLLDRNGGKSGYGEKLRISSLSQLLAIL
jgi:putative hydrolase of the HAD superfamily